jgi:hypothetical protein
MRIQLDLTEATVDHLKQLMQIIGVDTYKDLINNSITLLDWAVEEAQAGREIASVDEERGKYRELTMPILKHAQRAAKRERQFAGETLLTA